MQRITTLEFNLNALIEVTKGEHITIANKCNTLFCLEWERSSCTIVSIGSHGTIRQRAIARHHKPSNGEMLHVLGA